MKSNDKTNAIRLLDRAGAEYSVHSYETDGAVSGEGAAEILGVDPARIFKTLVTTGKSGAHYVFLIPAPAALDLKRAAATVGEKSIEMLKQKDLQPLTGYVHGGCSPLGMKKAFPTVVDASAAECERIIFSAGRIGLHIEASVDELSKAIPVELASLTVPSAE